MDVAILGCGYVGIELGAQLTAAGHDVVGVRRSDAGGEAIADAGFDAVQGDVTDPDDLAAVPAVDAVVYAASAGGRDAAAAREVYVEGLETAVETFAARDDPPDRFVYTSSTGVYGDRDGAWVDEETPLDPATERESVLVEAERTALDAPGPMDGTVARFAGLYGPDRYRLDRYLDGPVAEGYLNLVHRDDAAGAVRFLLAGDHARNEVVLVVDDEPVERPELAAWLAAECGVEPPDVRPSDAASGRARSSKRCSNERLRKLGYEYSYPTFREGYRSAVDEWTGDV
ncbi:SDR family oxidoreductase [Halomicrococcus gelatinilyticus]|uniref:SDR family oxidoreductase n=1 Tax=Halomicrococcus gelatinilyticus TaxID=1702103 RepID=UPI002E12A0AD